MRVPINLIFACSASAVAFAVVFVAWMATVAKQEGGDPLGAGYLVRMMIAMFVMALVVQIIYGGLLYLALAPRGGLRLWVILLAYVVPVALFGWHASDTSADIVGTVRWIGFASLVALVFWFFASRQPT